MFSGSSPYDPQETASFDDDEPLPQLTGTGSTKIQQQQQASLEVNTYPELSAVAKSSSHNNFNVLINIKAPKSVESTTADSHGRGAPLDLVAVLDISGSMAGPKLDLMKQAMGFVIRNLGPSDRLSIVSFSDRAQRICPLRLMNHSGKQLALHSVNSLGILGGTHIAAGLHTGAKVMTDRRFKNPVSSIIFLSDGCDTYTVKNFNHMNNTYTVNNFNHMNGCGGYDQLIPSSLRRGNDGLAVPIHTFGFGSDHDPALMNTIAEATRGTFSFIESVETIQDAFAQCIGGLLSVVVQELQVKVECDHKDLQLSSIKAGSYKTYIPLDKRLGFIEVGDLYAEEERNFLVEIDIPPSDSNIMQLLKITYAYKCPIRMELITMENAGKASIERPELVSEDKMVVSMEVDRERSRVQATEAIAKAKASAEKGNLADATGTLEECRNRISARRLKLAGGDVVCESLEEELLEIEKKMGNMGVYMKFGRAMATSGLNSHMQQRAASTGFESANNSSLPRMRTMFQTPVMAKMVLQSRQSLSDPSSGDQRKKGESGQSLSAPSSGDQSSSSEGEAPLISF